MEGSPSFRKILIETFPVLYKKLYRTKSQWKDRWIAAKPESTQFNEIISRNTLWKSKKWGKEGYL